MNIRLIIQFKRLLRLGRDTSCR